MRIDALKHFSRASRGDDGRFSSQAFGPASTERDDLVGGAAATSYGIEG